MIRRSPLTRPATPHLIMIVISLLLAAVSSFSIRDLSDAWSHPVYYSDKVAVLMYHHLEETPSPGLSTLAVRDFDEQMRLLKENGFSILSMEQYAGYMLEGAPVPDNAVLLTFDDGYESFYAHAYPILRKYEFPAANFVIVAPIDDRSRPGIPKLTWEQMREMQAAGMRFYSHTYDSHRLGPIDSDGHEGAVLAHALYLSDQGRMETTAEYVRRIADDLALAERRLAEELPGARGIVAFPYGEYDQAGLLEVLRKLGIELTFTTFEGINTRSDRLGLRIDANRSPSALIARLKAPNNAR